MSSKPRVARRRQPVKPKPAPPPLEKAVAPVEPPPAVMPMAFGDISTQANQVWRDFTSDGVPASGVHEPVKSEIRALFATIDSLVASGGGGGGGGVSAMVRSVEELMTVRNSANLPATDGVTIIYCGSYWNDNARGGGFLRYNSGAPTDTWRMGFMTCPDAEGRLWERLIEPQGIDFYMTGARGDGGISGAGSVSGTNDVDRLNNIADYLIAVTKNNAGIIPAKVSGGGGIFRCDKPLDFAKIGDSGEKWYLDLTGTVIASRANGLAGEVAFDFTACESAHINGGIVYGDKDTRPATGWFWCRLGGTSDDMNFQRPAALGQFLYAGAHNSGGENMHWEQAYFSNSYMGPCYGFAQDAHTYLRYDPPVACTITNIGTTQVKVTRTGAPHGMPDGWFIYIGERGKGGQRFAITGFPGDANSFTINYNNVANPLTLTDRYFKARYWSQSDRVQASDDVIQPFFGDGAFTSNFNGGQCIAPYGIAGLLDTSGGRRRFNCRVSATVYDDPTYGAAKTVNAITAPNTMQINAHAIGSGTPQAWPPLLIDYVPGAGSPNASFAGLLRVMSFVDANNITVAKIDGAAVTFTTESPAVTNSTVMRQNNFGGYGVHWILGGPFETPVYENIHMESGPGGDIAHGCMCHIYMQAIAPMRAPVLGSPVVVQVKGARFAEHTAHGEMGVFIVDTRTISRLEFEGEIRIADYGGGAAAAARAAGTFRAHNGTSFVTMSIVTPNWKIRGPLYLDHAAAVNPDVDYKGDYIDTLNCQNKSRRSFRLTGFAIAATGTTDIAHGCYKAPDYANVRILGNVSDVVTIDSIDATNLKVRMRSAAGAQIGGSPTLMVEAVV